MNACILRFEPINSKALTVQHQHIIVFALSVKLMKLDTYLTYTATVPTLTWIQSTFLCHHILDIISQEFWVKQILFQMISHMNGS